ncbi:hypothetical protein [Glycomyces arizonensis]|uniref:hypothetical protein n=1 Tax=Glycomyces arizonensis TaxID=256035 RepID=UPI00041E69F5|nr:hypothetical protein [Glycomyces arizonensis]
MRRLAAIPAVLLLALGACGDGEDEPEGPVETADTEQSPSIDPSETVELDLESAGGACPFIDGAQLNSITGEDFRFASGGPEEDTGEDAPDQATCAVQTGEAAYPDLTLFIIGTDASVDVYKEQAPEDSKSTEGLGEAGYWIVHTEDTGAGPALEMGWYDGGDIFEMRYTTPEGTDPAAVEALVNDFAGLANGINDAHAAQDE